MTVTSCVFFFLLFSFPRTFVSFLAYFLILFCAYYDWEGFHIRRAFSSLNSNICNRTILGSRLDVVSCSRLSKSYAIGPNVGILWAKISRIGEIRRWSYRNWTDQLKESKSRNSWWAQSKKCPQTVTKSMLECHKNYQRTLKWIILQLRYLSDPFNLEISHFGWAYSLPFLLASWQSCSCGTWMITFTFGWTKAKKCEF